VTTTATETTAESRFCSVCARQAGLDPAGHAGAPYDVIVAAELPLPWPYGLWSDAGRLPPEALAITQHIRDEYARTREVRIGMLGIAPDARYSAPDMRRVLCWRRPCGPFAQFARGEYLVPTPQLGPLMAALALEPERAGDFASYRQEGDARDLLVCTHGAVDAACSKFGYPAYRQLRALADGSGGALRVWRTTHFGGHVFAPTLIDMPHGSYWAFIGREEAELLAARRGPAERLRDHYRGWAGVHSPFLQVLERELFVRHGWEWLAYDKAGRILAHDPAAAVDEHGDSEPAWAEVRLDYRAPDGTAGTATARVELAARVDLIHTSGGPETYAYPQYAVAWLREETSAQ
jgi:hypothetical protein